MVEQLWQLNYANAFVGCADNLMRQNDELMRQRHFLANQSCAQHNIVQHVHHYQQSVLEPLPDMLQEVHMQHMADLAYGIEDVQRSLLAEHMSLQAQAVNREQLALHRQRLVRCQLQHEQEQLLKAKLQADAAQREQQRRRHQVLLSHQEILNQHRLRIAEERDVLQAQLELEKERLHAETQRIKEAKRAPLSATVAVQTQNLVDASNLFLTTTQGERCEGTGSGSHVSSSRRNSSSGGGGGGDGGSSSSSRSSKKRSGRTRRSNSNSNNDSAESYDNDFVMGSEDKYEDEFDDDSNPTSRNNTSGYNSSSAGHSSKPPESVESGSLNAHHVTRRASMSRDSLDSIQSSVSAASRRNQRTAPHSELLSRTRGKADQIASSLASMSESITEDSKVDESVIESIASD